MELAPTVRADAPAQVAIAAPDRGGSAILTQPLLTGRCSMPNSPIAELLKLAVADVDVSAVAVDRHGTIVAVNPAAARVLAAAPEALIGRSLSSLLAPQGDGTLVDRIAALSADGHSLIAVRTDRQGAERFVLRRHPLSGAVSGGDWTVATLDPAPPSFGAPPAAGADAPPHLGPSPDLDAILGGVSEGVVVLDRSLRYVYANDAALRIFGVSRAETLGKTPHDLFTADALEHTLPVLQLALGEQRVFEYEFVDSGSGRWFEHRVYPSSDGVSVFFSDISLRKRVEASLKRSEAAQRLLVSIHDATRGAGDSQAVVRGVVDQVGLHLGVGRCVYGEADAEGETFAVLGEFVAEPERPRVELPLRLPRELYEKLRAGDSGSAHTLPGQPVEPDTKWVCVPVGRDGHVVAALLVQDAASREWRPDDCALLEQIAERTWLAVEHARSQAALRESRDVLTLAMRGGRMGIWSRNLATNQVWWSRELEELFGLPPGGFAGTETGFLSLIHDDERAAVAEAVEAAVRQATGYVVEFRFRHVSGEWRWMEGRGRATYDAEGRPQTLYGLGIDITERKRAERELAAARDTADADAERLTLALNAASLGDWYWDAASDAVTGSPRAAALFGGGDMPQATWTAVKDRLHPDDRDRVQLALDTAIRDRTSYSAEYRVRSTSGERWVSMSGRARYDEEGRLLGMFGVIQDASADRLLLRLEDALRPLTDPAAITYTSARMLGEHLRTSRCAYAVVADDEDTFELVGNYVHDTHSIVGRYRLGQFGAECLRQMRCGEPYVVSDSANDPRIDAAARPVYEATAIAAVICVPILKSQRLVAAMAVHSGQRRIWLPTEVELVQRVASRCWESLERARVEIERMQLLRSAESANRAKDEFLAMLGHELRNPLSPILTALQLMKLRHDDTFERERTVIERQVAHLTRLVDDLLDVSRIARGKVELRLMPVDIAEVLAGAIETASPLLEARAHSLTVDVPRGRIWVHGDMARLSQVFANLLTNAAKYTPPGGHIRVSAAPIDDAVEVHVADNGVGIDPAVQPHIFDLFVQGKQTLDRAQGGLGLGLSIVKNLVERHRGAIRVESGGLNRGSDFIVRLPRVTAGVATAAPPRQPATPRPSTFPIDVLIVDDNVDAADLLAETLSARGLRTYVAHDGPEALRVASRVRPGAAFLDIGLPVMDGYELALRLRALPGLEGVILVAVTGYGQEQDRRRSADAGFQHHLVKPVDAQMLEAVLTASL